MTLKSALDGVNFRLIGVRKHQAIFREGERATAVYRVERGCLRLQIEGREGHREIVTFLFPGDVFFGGFQTHWASAYSVTDSSVAAFPLASFWAHISRDTEAAMAALFSADDRLDEVAHHLALLSHAKGDTRLRWFLQWMASRSRCDDGSGAIYLPMSRRDIADFLGIAPETVSRLFLRMEGRGELRRYRGHRCVLQFEGRAPREALAVTP